MYFQFAICVQVISIHPCSVDQVNLIFKLIGSSFLPVIKNQY